MMEKYYNIKVYVLYTDFGKFNSNATLEYFNYIDITWELSTPYAQYQNKVFK